MKHIHRSVALSDRSSIGEARRTAIAVAQTLGFSEDRRNDLAIVITEAATNVILHAKSGEMLICPGGDDHSTWIDLMAIDAGPGINDISRAMEDGFSTIGTHGQGLGAIGRLSDSSALHSLADKGTVYWSRFDQTRTSVSPAMGIVSVPVKGESVSGDGYFTLRDGARSLYMLVDGLGHGVGASEAAKEALSVIRASARESASEIVRRTHDALKKTRGAAMSVAIVDSEQKILTYAGVGNIGASLTTGATERSLISQNGTLGAILPRVVQEYTYPVERNALLLMFSDGLASRASVTAYTGIQGRHPALIAGVLYRDFARKRDDVTVLVARMEDERG